MFTMDEDAIVVRRGDFPTLSQCATFDAALEEFGALQRAADADRTRYDDEARSCRRFVLQGGERLFAAALPRMPELSDLVHDVAAKYHAWTGECEAASRPSPAEEASSSITASASASSTSEHANTTAKASPASSKGSCSAPTYKRPDIYSTVAHYCPDADTEEENNRYTSFSSDREAAERMLADAEALQKLILEAVAHARHARARYTTAIEKMHEDYQNLQQRDNEDGFLWQVPDKDSPPPRLELTFKGELAGQCLQASLPQIQFEITALNGDAIATRSATRLFSVILHDENAEDDAAEDFDVEQGRIAVNIVSPVKVVADVLARAVWLGMKERAIEFALAQRSKLVEHFGAFQGDGALFADIGMFDEDGALVAAPAFLSTTSRSRSGDKVEEVNYLSLNGVLGGFASQGLSFPFALKTRHRFGYSLAVGGGKGREVVRWTTAAPAEKEKEQTQAASDARSLSFAFKVHPLTGDISSAGLVETDCGELDPRTSYRKSPAYRERSASIDGKRMLLSTIDDVHSLFFRRNMFDAGTTSRGGSTATTSASDNEVKQDEDEQGEDEESGVGEVKIIVAGEQWEQEKHDTKTKLQGVGGDLALEGLDADTSSGSSASATATSSSTVRLRCAFRKYAAFEVESESSPAVQVGGQSGMNVDTRKRILKDIRLRRCLCNIDANGGFCQDFSDDENRLLKEKVPDERIGLLQCEYAELCLHFETQAEAERFADEFRLIKRMTADRKFFGEMPALFQNLNPWALPLIKVMFPTAVLDDPGGEAQLLDEKTLEPLWYQRVDFCTEELYVPEPGEESTAVGRRAEQLQRQHFGGATWLDLARSVLTNRVKNPSPDIKLRDPISFHLVWPGPGREEGRNEA
eukprot:g2861.t1